LLRNWKKIAMANTTNPTRTPRYLLTSFTM